jgi:hypothetical protein
MDKDGCIECRPQVERIAVLKAEVADFKANNRYQHGYGDGERDAKKHAHERIAALEYLLKRAHEYVWVAPKTEWWLDLSAAINAAIAGGKAPAVAFVGIGAHGEVVRMVDDSADGFEQAHQEMKKLAGGKDVLGK